MKVRILSIAEREYQDAYDYYEGIVEGLGNQFKEELLVALKRIEDFLKPGRGFRSKRVAVAWNDSLTD